MLNYSCQNIDNSDELAIIKALKDPILTGGKQVLAFERALCEYTGAKYACVLNSATSALELTYLALNLKDKLLLSTPISFVATTSAALLAGARVEFVDIKPNGNLDANKLEARLKKGGVAAFCTIDYAGFGVDYDKFNELSQKYGAYFISDASHALGSKYKGRKIGQLAKASILSFHPIKPITTLEGGAVLSDDYELIEKIRLLRSHGMIKKELWYSDMTMLGYNYRLSDLACALGINQLKKLDSELAKRQKIVDFYNNYFKDNPFFTTLKNDFDEISSNHLYPILLKPSLWDKKESLFKELLKLDISVQVHYRPIYEFSFYKRLYPKLFLKEADSFYKSELSIVANSKMNIKYAKFVASSLLKLLSKYK